mmetsp:Transcript_25294/g.34698  ORF Transcript_25294/g.34698 Transcript_25294/m.34698 type:complete len:89 (+) Transcript_25294:49-315(+)
MPLMKKAVKDGGWTCYEAPGLKVVRSSDLGVSLYEGLPGAQCGHAVNEGVSSYFDELWKKDQKVTRYYLCLTKTGKTKKGRGKKKVFN